MTNEKNGKAPDIDLSPKGPTSNWTPPEEHQKREQQLVQALQFEIQAVCSKHALSVDTTVTAVASALAIIILLNAKEPTDADKFRKRVKDTLKTLVTKNWATMQPVKDKLAQQLAEQLKAQSDGSPAEPEENPASGDVRSDGTG